MGALCFSCSQCNPGPQQSWKGSNTPSSCRNGKRPGFSCCAVFVLFLFLFCFLRDPWKQPVPAPAAPAARGAAPSAARAPSGTRRAQGALAALTALIPTKSSPRRAAPMGALPERSRRFSCLDPAQKIFLFSSSCRFLSSASG